MNEDHQTKAKQDVNVMKILIKVIKNIRVR